MTWLKDANDRKPNNKSYLTKVSSAEYNMASKRNGKQWTTKKIWINVVYSTLYSFDNRRFYYYYYCVRIYGGWWCYQINEQKETEHKNGNKNKKKMKKILIEEVYFILFSVFMRLKAVYRYFLLHLILLFSVSKAKKATLHR